MNFTEQLVPAFSGIELKSSDGKAIPTGKATVVPGDKRKMVVPIAGHLAAGTYSVGWHAVSVDTHRVSGKYTFKIAQ